MSNQSLNEYQKYKQAHPEEDLPDKVLDEAADWCGYRIQELEAEVARLREQVTEAWRMAGKQRTRALKAESRIGELNKEILDLQQEVADINFQYSDEENLCCKAEEAGQYYLAVLNRVTNWFAERDLPCPICGKIICDPDCDLKNALEDLL